MKQTLSLKLGQQLTMTPQLQQAIRLLQLSTMDLQQEIQQTLESNPMLELEEDEPTPDGNELDEPEEVPDEPISAETADELDGDGDGDNQELLDPELAELETDSGVAEAAGEDADEHIPEDLPVDTSWDEIYEPGPASSAPADDADWNLEERNSVSESLQEHLHWQLNLTPMSDRDRLIATAVIEAVDPDGMLTVSMDDLLAALNAEGPDLSGPPGEAAPLPAADPDLDPEPDVMAATADSAETLEDPATPGQQDRIDPTEPVELDELLAVLKRVQQFDPTGVAARDLGECLALQLKVLEEGTPWRQEAIELVTEYLDLLASRDFNTLKRRSRLDEPDLACVVNLIQSLNPRPGSAVSSEQPEYIVPDVVVYKHNGRWQVELNAEATPRLKINDLYAGMVKRADNSADNTYLKDNLQEARWFLKSLQSRHETLLKVATKIVEHQRGFLEYGEEASRVTSRKYMHTPRGIFELKYFFSSHVSTNTGGEVSSTAIRALIRKLTADENPRKPLSDNKIAAILAEQNIKVARRTVAKYRESMAIPPSNERKRLV
jgi:RNA polymerase sigma-54 factor